MKKILCIALFSIVIMANATEKKGTPTNTEHEKEVVTDYSNKIIMNNLEKTSEDDVFFGCGSEANGWYDIYISQGFTHREARALRRVWVRKCRGNGPGGWLNLPVQF